MTHRHTSKSLKKKSYSKKNKYKSTRKKSYKKNRHRSSKRKSYKKISLKKNKSRFNRKKLSIKGSGITEEDIINKKFLNIEWYNSKKIQIDKYGMYYISLPPGTLVYRGVDKDFDEKNTNYFTSLKTGSIRAFRSSQYEGGKLQIFEVIEPLLILDLSDKSNWIRLFKKILNHHSNYTHYKLKKIQDQNKDKNEDELNTLINEFKMKNEDHLKKIHKEIKTYINTFFSPQIGYFKPSLDSLNMDEVAKILKEKDTRIGKSKSLMKDDLATNTVNSTFICPYLNKESDGWAYDNLTNLNDQIILCNEKSINKVKKLPYEIVADTRLIHEVTDDKNPNMKTTRQCYIIRSDDKNLGSISSKSIGSFKYNVSDTDFNLVKDLTEDEIKTLIEDCKKN